MGSEMCIRDSWNSLMKGNSIFPVCNTSEKLQKIYRSIIQLSSFLSNTIPPCSVMLIPLAVQRDTKTGTGQLEISVVYSTSQYQEIINIADFSFDSMFSGIGGFVGIFLGYSLLQIADLLKMLVYRKWRSTFVVVSTTFDMFCASYLPKGTYTKTRVH